MPFCCCCCCCCTCSVSVLISQRIPSTFFHYFRVRQFRIAFFFLSRRSHSPDSYCFCTFHFYIHSIYCCCCVALLPLLLVLLLLLLLSRQLLLFFSCYILNLCHAILSCSRSFSLCLPIHDKQVHTFILCEQVYLKLEYTQRSRHNIKYVMKGLPFLHYLLWYG